MRPKTRYSSVNSASGLIDRPHVAERAARVLELVLGRGDHHQDAERVLQPTGAGHRSCRSRSRRPSVAKAPSPTTIARCVSWSSPPPTRASRQTSPVRSSATPSSRCGPRAVEVAVVSPASFRHFGIAYGDGIAGQPPPRPWLVLALPLFFSGVRARRATSGAACRSRPRALAALPRSPRLRPRRRSCSSSGERTSSWLAGRVGARGGSSAGPLVVAASEAFRARRA